MNTVITSLKAFVFFTLLTGVLYPLAVSGIGNVLFPYRASGSLISQGGKIVGSELIGQKFTGPKHFWPRPSAIDYNPQPSGGSNLAPSNADFRSAVEGRKAQGLTHDMLYTSGSGLDPHISPAAAFDQVDRIAAARGMGNDGKARIRDLIRMHTETRQFGVLGEERVNVLKLNLALDREAPHG